jgi:hypothetical protein
MIEIKAPNTATHIDTLLSQTIPRKYVLQMHWQMEVYGREWNDFVSYDPRLPEGLQLFIKRVELDQKLMAEIRTEAKENTMIEKFTVEIAVGDRVEVGRMHLANQTIKAIEIDKWGHPVIVLESGRKRGLLNCRLKKLIPDDVERVQEPAEVMMTKEQWAEAQAKIDAVKKK